MTKMFRVFHLTSVLASLWLVNTDSEAKRSYIQRLPNVPIDWPAVGHLHATDGTGYNQFGNDFASAGKKWTPELCFKDSDGDGWTNGEELGDPFCIWVAGQPHPIVDYTITHPGHAESYPTGNHSTGGAEITKVPTNSPSEFRKTAAPSFPQGNAPWDNPVQDPTVSALEWWVIPHVVFGLASVGLLVPLAISMTSFCRKATNGNFKELHLVLTGVAGLFMAVTFFLPIGTHSGLEAPGSLHTLSALAAIILAILQSATGLTAYFKSRWLLNNHTQVARFAVFPIFAVLLASGYSNFVNEYEEEPPVQATISVVAWVHVLLFLIFGFAHEYFQFKRRSRFKRISRQDKIEAPKLEIEEEGERDIEQRLRGGTSSNSEAIEMNAIQAENPQAVKQSESRVDEIYESRNLGYVSLQNSGLTQI